jgi:hypothetical protein
VNTLFALMPSSHNQLKHKLKQILSPIPMKFTIRSPKEEDSIDKINSPQDLRKLAKRYRWQRQVLVCLLGFIVLAGAYFYAIRVTESFWLQRLVVAYSPLVHKAQAKEAEKPKTYTIDQVVDAVHILESSGGVKDGCLAKGKINGFGFAQHGSGDVWNCYKNYAQVRALVEQWFAEKVPALGLSTALCYYNLGKVDGKYVNDCPYYRNFLKVVES